MRPRDATIKDFKDAGYVFDRHGANHDLYKNKKGGTKMKYIYSALFEVKPDKVYARVPDLPGCITTGNNLEDAIEQITDAASIWLVSAEDNGDEIPSATAQSLLKHNKHTEYSLIQIDTLAYRAKIDTRSVRKNVSLPAWMAALAEKRGINCSKVLQNALREQL